MLRHAGLQNGTAGFFTSAAPSHDLCDQGKGSLIAAEIAGVQSLVHRQHTYQRDIGEIQPLADHLRSQHDVILTLPEFLKPFLVGIAGHGGVRVHAEYPCFRHDQPEFFFQPLGAKAHFPQVLSAAGGTGFHHVLRMSAVMAHQAVVDFVIGHGDTAIGAVHRLIAGRTADNGMIPAAVQQQQRLAARF